MGTQSRKHREIRDREKILLGRARQMLIAQGFAGLSMDRLAEETEYSKGTLYQHFTSKEDLVTALAWESNAHRLELFDRARHFPGRPRERIVAMGVADELFARLHPHFFRSEQIIRLADLECRATPERWAQLIEQDNRLIGWVRGIVHDALRQGDLRADAPLAPGPLVMALFAQALGTHSVMVHYPHVLPDLGITAPFVEMHAVAQVLLDGNRWRPLSRDWDYGQTRARVLQEIFPDESQQAGTH